jgi:hypothetical protein
VRPIVAQERSAWRWVLILVLLVGAAGSAHEPIRAFVRPTWQMTGHTLSQSLEMSTDDSFPPLPPHYVAHLNQAGLAAMLREPTMVTPYPAAPAKATP